MADEWDDIILHRDIPANVKVNTAPAFFSDVGPSVQGTMPKIPKAKDIVAVIPKKEEATARPEIKPRAPLPSPYVSKLPAVWSADLANKFAVAALALTIAFGAYSFGTYISDFGVENTIVMTKESLSQAASAIAPFFNF